MKYENMGRDEFSKLVKYDEKDQPDKYGFTKKMHTIWDLVEDGKSVGDGDFKPTDADRAFYDRYKRLFEFEKKQRGKPYKFPRYMME